MNANEEKMRPPNIYQRINAIRAEVAYVQKDKQVSGAGGGYWAVTHDNVTAQVREHFVKHGVVIVPQLVAHRIVDTGRKTSGGTPIVRFEGDYSVEFVNADDPADRIIWRGAAHADDHGDKAPGKALSYATKYALLKVLMLESGDDEESRVGKKDDGTELDDDAQAVLTTLRGKALEGMGPLEAAWTQLGKDYKHKLVGHLPSLKEAATKAAGR